MTDTALNPGAGPEQARTLERSANVKTQVVAFDVGGAAGPEKLVDDANPMPVGGSLLEAIQTLIAIIAGTIQNHNAPFFDGTPGQVILGKRRDSDSTLVADGDLNTFNMDEEGRLKVSSKPASYPDITGGITAVQAAIGTPVAGGTVSGDVSRASNVMALCTGTFSTVNCAFEGSLEATGETNWFSIQAVRSNANTIETTTGNLSAQPTYGWEMSVNALRRVRVRCTARTSGTQSWRFVQGTYATEPIPAAQVSATQPVSVAGYPTAAASADGLANPTVTQIAAAALNFNGASWDRVRNNISLAVDTSSARVASGVGATFTNHNGSAVSFWLNVTAVSGTTPSMTVRLQWSPDNGATWLDMDTTNLQTAAITATGNFALHVGPGLAVTANRSANLPAPRLMRFAWSITGTTPSFTFTSWANTSA